MKLIRPITINDAALTSSNVAETDYTAWLVGTTYAQGTRVRVVAADYHKIFESKAGGNVGHDPVADTAGTYWAEVGATNRWRMFDNTVQGQTTNAGSIDVTITVAGRVDSVAFFNCDAATIQVTMTDEIDGVVFDQTVSMVADSGIDDMYDYFFEPVERLADKLITGMPPYASTTIRIQINDPTGTAKCGECVLGLSREIGATLYGAGVGIQDYSRKEVDQFGTYRIVERAFAKRTTLDVKVNNTFVDQLQTLLAGYRATPIVYVGSDDFASTLIYGFYKEFATTIRYVSHSICSIQIEGLT